MSERPDPDEVGKLLAALEVWVDERAKVLVAAPELREARERAAHSAKQSVEITLRKALAAAGKGEVSSVPTMTPRNPGSSDRLLAARAQILPEPNLDPVESTPVRPHPHPLPSQAPPALPPGATPAGGYTLAGLAPARLTPLPAIDASAGLLGRRAADPHPACPGPDCPMCNGEVCNLCGAGTSLRSSNEPDCEHDTAERHMAPSYIPREDSFPPHSDSAPDNATPMNIDLMRGDDEDDLEDP